jgi:hypothetical protein
MRRPSPGSVTSQDPSHSIKPGRAPPEHDVEEGANARAYFASDEATQRQLSDAVGGTEDWTATASQLEEAIERPAPRLIAEYLCHVADVLGQLCAVLGADPNASEPWRLTFRHRRPGKPIDSQVVLLEEDAIAMVVRLRLAQVKKLEAAVSDVRRHFGLSRATVMRALKAHKRRQLEKPGSC